MTQFWIHGDESSLFQSFDGVTNSNEHDYGAPHGKFVSCFCTLGINQHQFVTEALMGIQWTLDMQMFFLFWWIHPYSFSWFMVSFRSEKQHTIPFIPILCCFHPPVFSIVFTRHGDFLLFTKELSSHPIWDVPKWLIFCRLFYHQSTIVYRCFSIVFRVTWQIFQWILCLRIVWSNSSPSSCLNGISAEPSLTQAQSMIEIMGMMMDLNRKRWWEYIYIYIDMYIYNYI